MKYLLVSLFIVNCLSTSAQIEDVSSFINTKYGDQLTWKDLDDIGGAVIGRQGSKTLAVGHYRSGTNHYLVLELQKDDGILLDSYDVLKFDRDDNQVIVYRTCRSNERPNSKIIALVNYVDNAEYFTQVISAWIANEKTMTFDKIATTDIDCSNIHFGI